MTKFAIFILTYGRPHAQKTLNTLQRLKTAYPIFLICSDDDPTLDIYKEKYGDMVVVFNKEEARKKTRIDRMDNFGKTSLVIFARNFSFVIAKEMGFSDFWVLDDDYTEFSIPNFGNGKWFCFLASRYKKFDLLLEECIKFYKSCPKLLGFSFSQGGDFIGGITKDKMRVKRKCMNSFFCSVDKPIEFVGSINEDTNFYISTGARDGFCMQIHNIKLNQTQTQAQDRGLTDIYLEMGTYVKSFYSVILQPRAVSITPMGDKHLRLHHKINYNAICPKILRENVKKV